MIVSVQGFSCSFVTDIFIIPDPAAESMGYCFKIIDIVSKEGILKYIEAKEKAT